MKKFCRPFSAAFGLFLSLATLPAATTDDPSARTTTKFTGGALPTPPMQAQPWTPPDTNLSPVVVDAFRTLFAQGLADPRGCDYREIEIVAGSGRDSYGERVDNPGVVKTHGWVLPAAAGTGAFAVCWNGLVYPVLAVGAKADVRADVAATLKADQAWIDQQRADAEQRQANQAAVNLATGKPPPPPAAPFSVGRWRNDWQETESVSFSSMVPLKAALLFRLSQGDLAGQLWHQWFYGGDAYADQSTYPNLATEWVREAFDRVVRAHERSDDNFARLGARTLASLQASVEAAMKAAYKAEAVRFGLGADWSQQAHLVVLDQLPDLIADQERRLREPRPAPLGLAPDGPKGAARITALIGDLELMVAPRSSVGFSHGDEEPWPDFKSDPVVKALIAEGDPAVPPLLDCLEHDRRLTRTGLIGVQHPAYYALRGILKSYPDEYYQELYDVDSPDLKKREAVAAHLRDYWQKNRALSVAERWYQTLADDGASDGDRLLAARGMVELADREAYFQVDAAPKQQALAGDSLRRHPAPSVADLLARRMNELAARDFSGHDGMSIIRHAVALARALARWDGAEGRQDDLRQLSTRLEATYLAWKPDVMGYLAHEMIALYEIRDVLGDARALEDYVRWIMTLRPSDFEPPPGPPFPRGTPPFGLLSLHLENSSIRQAVEQLFVSPASPWPSWFKKGAANSPFQVGLGGNSLLIALAAYRQVVLRELADKTEAGTIVADATGWTNVRPGGGSQRVEGLDFRQDPLAPPDGALIHYRVCDGVAFTVSLLEGSPKFALYWPEANRDQAVAACAAFLQEYGDNFKFHGKYNLAYDNYSNDQTHLAFPSLDHPATPEDVAQHRAIFSLSGERRLWKLPRFPMTQADWPMLKDNLAESSKTDPVTGKTEKFLFYNNSGTVWQAEEVLEGGQWVRYFGFVSQHDIVRVPAAEVEFPNWGNRLTGGMDCGLILSGGKVENWQTRVAAGEPLQAAVLLRNRQGVTQSAPGLANRSGQTAKLAAGVQFKLFRKDEISSAATGWQEIAARPSEPAATVAAGKKLEATEEWEALRVELRDFFEISRPGIYKVKVVFSAPFPNTGETNEAVFVLTEPAAAKP